MTLKQLYYFQSVAEFRHFTCAAEKSHVTQSALSHGIQTLEKELNVELFSQGRYGTVLTKYGELFLPYVQKSLGTLEDGISALEEYAAQDGKMYVHQSSNSCI